MGSSAPHSASNSENSPTHSTPLMSPNPNPNPNPNPKVEDTATKNGVTDVLNQNPDFAHFQILDSAENMDKYRKYEADYTRRLMAKYFSKKNLYGGSIYDEKMTIDDETIMSSRWPCTQSFVDPVKGFEEQSNPGSTSET